jgi:hypothetical protein
MSLDIKISESVSYLLEIKWIDKNVLGLGVQRHSKKNEPKSITIRSKDSWPPKTITSREPGACTIVAFQLLRAGRQFEQHHPLQQYAQE